MRYLLILVLFVSCAHPVRIVSPEVSGPRVVHEAKAKRAMATSQGQATTRAALWALNEGGNIIDAFVAASFTISIERPHSTGLGGGGFLLFYSAKLEEVFAFDFREMAPQKSTSSMYLSPKGEVRPLMSQEGGLAVATPGLVRGLYDIHKRFGKLSWHKTLTPAIRLAREGLPLYPELQVALEDRKNLLLKNSDAKKIFFPEGKTPPLGAMIFQVDLAKTLERIAERGASGFYEGKIADAIVRTVRKNGGIISSLDLKNYRMVQRSALSGVYKGLKIFSMPPPSSGGIHVIQILKMLEPHNLKDLKPQTADSIHLMANAMQRAFLDRANYLGDPDFHPVPTEKLLDESYLKTMSNLISGKSALKYSELKPVPFFKESDDTTHFSIADEEGNLVASTQTINGWFGSGVIAEGTGVVLNNEMDDFAQKVGAQNLFGAMGGEYNLVAPKKRPLSSMSPTIVLKNDEPYLALGSPSGTRIITCVAQSILNVVEFEMPLYEALASTRIHQQWQPDVLKIEAPYLSPQVEEKLSDKGHNLVHEKLGCRVQAVQKTKNGWTGVSDPRGEGFAQGLD